MEIRKRQQLLKIETTLTKEEAEQIFGNENFNFIGELNILSNEINLDNPELVYNALYIISKYVQMPNCNHNILLKNDYFNVILRYTKPDCEFNIRELSLQILLFSSLKSQEICDALICNNVFQYFDEIVKNDLNIIIVKYISQISVAILSFSDKYYEYFYQTSLLNSILLSLKESCKQNSKEPEIKNAERNVFSLFISIFEFQESLSIETANAFISLFIEIMNDGRDFLLNCICTSLYVLILRFSYMPQLIANHGLMAFLYSYLKDTSQERNWESILQVISLLFEKSSNDIIIILMKIISPKSLCDILLYNMKKNYTSDAFDLLYHLIVLNNTIVNEIPILDIASKFSEVRDGTSFLIKKSFSIFMLAFIDITKSVDLFMAFLENGILDTIIEILNLTDDEQLTIFALDKLTDFYNFVLDSSLLTTKIKEFYTSQVMEIVDKNVNSSNDSIYSKCEKLQNLFM